MPSRGRSPTDTLLVSRRVSGLWGPCTKAHLIRPLAGDQTPIPRTYMVGKEGLTPKSCFLTSTLTKDRNKSGAEATFHIQSLHVRVGYKILWESWLAGICELWTQLRVLPQYERRERSRQTQMATPSLHTYTHAPASPCAVHTCEHIYPSIHIHILMRKQIHCHQVCDSLARWADLSHAL